AQADPNKVYCLAIEIPPAELLGSAEEVARIRLVPRCSGLRFTGRVLESVRATSAALGLTRELLPWRILRGARDQQPAVRAERARRNAMGSQEIATAQALEAKHSDLSTLPSLNEFDPSATNLPDPKPSMLGNMMKVLSFGIEGLDRATQATREVAIFANQKTNLEGFKKRFAGALNGDVARMTRHEFAELMIGSETYNAMRQSSVIPSWFAALAQPEQAMLGGKNRPKVSFGDVFSVGLDMVVDPFTLLSLTPTGAGVRFGKIATKGLKPLFRPASRTLSKWFGAAPGSRTPWSFINFARDPMDVLPTAMYQDIASAEFRSNGRQHGMMMQVQNAFKGVSWRGEDDQQIGAWLHSLHVGKDGALRPGSIKLSQSAQAAANALEPIIERNIADLVAVGAIKPADLGKKLENFYPALVGKHSIRIDIQQSWSAENLGKIGLALRRKGVNTGPIKLNDVSGIDSVKDFIYGVARKVELEPALLKYAPKTKRLGGVEAEHEITRGMSQFQKIYLKNFINVFTGNNKGRTEININSAVEYFSEQVSHAPFGKKVIALQRKFGQAGPGDTLSDFSNANKLSGMFIHQIIRSTLGGNLSSAVQNLTQVLNFTVAKGIPATIKGMIRWSDPNYKLLRKSANLQQDFHAMWDEGMWVSKFGKKYDDVI
ncbi:MAG: hypothetical protein MUP44_02505, partial [Anaerolineales bacterium]|nr:hypothetical protein [Anaerolineales bacterium]